jgi:hypothetical protein
MLPLVSARPSRTCPPAPTPPPSPPPHDAPLLWTHLLGWLAEAEFSLDDERLDSRCQRLLFSCLSATDATVAGLAAHAGDAAVRAAERFLANDRVEISTLRQRLYATTLRAIDHAQAREVVLAYDPCQLSFKHQTTKKGRVQIGQDKTDLGYTWLNVAALDPASGALFGALHQMLFSEDGPDDRDEVDYAQGILDPKIEQDAGRNYKQQLSVYAKIIDQRVPTHLTLIFVADTDFDDGLTLRDMGQTLSPRCHFVIRGDAQRVVQVAQASWLPANRRVPSEQRPVSSASQEYPSVYFSEILPFIPRQPFRDLPVDARGRGLAPGALATRVARLQMGALPICLARKSERAMRYGIEETPVWLNVVIVDEIDPPAGKTGLQWILLTDLPIDTVEQRILIVERYLTRWRIEEFFRTVKATMKLEESALGSPEPTARLLFFLTLRAMVLDALRQQVGLLAGQPPTKEQRKELREGKKAAEQEETKRRQSPGRAVPDGTRRAWMVLSLLVHYGRWGGWYQGSLGNEVLLRGWSLLLHDLASGRFLWLLGADPTEAETVAGRRKKGSKKDVWP